MTVTVPEGISYDGMVRVQWIPTIAAIAAPTVAEVTAALAVGLECYIPDGGLTTGATTSVRESGRLCMTVVARTPGSTTYSLTLKYVFDQQNNVTDNDAYTTLKPGTSGYIAIFWGKDATETLAAADVADVYKVECGPQVKDNPTRNGEQTVTQEFFVAEFHADAVVAAA